MLLGDLGEVLGEHAALIQEVFQALGINEGQVALEEKSMKARQDLGDCVGMFVQESIHDVLLGSSWPLPQPAWDNETPFDTLFGCGFAALGKAKFVIQRNLGKKARRRLLYSGQRLGGCS